MIEAESKYTYTTEEPENDDFDIDQWVLCTERKQDEIFQIESMSSDYLFDAGRRQYDPDYCEVITSTDDPRVDL